MSEQTEFGNGRKYKKQQNNFKKCICGATPNIPLCGVKCEFSVGSLSKHHSWTRRGPLRKISCHPFLKIFVNLVSSVCGFISTCINVSSLVTEAHYFTEDIIKNVWPLRTGIQGGVRGVGLGGGGGDGDCEATSSCCSPRLRFAAPQDSDRPGVCNDKQTGWVLRAVTLAGQEGVSGNDKCFAD